MSTKGAGRTGHLYAVAFSSGTVKVGQSRDVSRRIAAHASAAAAHGITTDCVWVSEPVDRLDERERELLAYCATRWKCTTGDEYFRDADITQIVEFANRAGVPTRELAGRPAPDPMVGTSYWRTFKGHPSEAAAVRTWVRKKALHQDAAAVAHELFVAVIESGADAIDVVLSTAGNRLRVRVVGSEQLSVLHSHGPGWRIVEGLSRTSGVTTDGCGLWAELDSESAS